MRYFQDRNTPEKLVGFISFFLSTLRSLLISRRLRPHRSPRGAGELHRPLRGGGRAEERLPDPAASRVAPDGRRHSQHGDRSPHRLDLPGGSLGAGVSDARGRRASPQRARGAGRELPPVPGTRRRWRSQ